MLEMYSPVPMSVIISCSAGWPLYWTVMPSVRTLLAHVVGVSVASYPVNVRV